MVLLVVGGTLLVLLGMIYCTERIDQHWKNRKPEIIVLPFPAAAPTEVMIRYEDINETRRYETWRRLMSTACLGCHMDDEPLNLDGHCRYCAELQAIEARQRFEAYYSQPGRVQGG